MKSAKAKLVTILLAFFFASLLLVVVESKPRQLTQLKVDVNHFLADVSDQPIGIGLNFVGDRPNISEPLKQMKVGTLRYATNEYSLFDASKPNKSKVAIQDLDLWPVKSFAKPDGTWWDKLNFDNFMALCQSTNAEPFIVVGIDAIAYRGSAPHATPEEVIESAVAWVKYANIDQGYQVKYWEIGNESNIQHHNQIIWTPEQYAQTVVQIAQAMKKVDPTINIGANGMRIKENDDWWQRTMPIIKNDVDFLITHQYSWIKDYQEWKESPYQYTYNISDARDAIERYNSALRLNVTENSSFNPSISHSNNTWKMLHNFEVLGQTLCFNQVDYIHFWTSRWLESDPYGEDYSAFDDNYQLMPMGYPLKVWNSFLLTQMVYATEASGTIRTWASYAPSDRSLNILLLNKDTISQNVSITLENYSAKTGFLDRWVLQGATPESTDVTWSKSGSIPSWNGKIKTTLKPLSVTVIALSSSKVD